MVNTNKGKTKIFINRLRVDISKDVLTGDNPPKTYTKVIGRSQRLETIRLKMAKESGILEQPKYITSTLRYEHTLSGSNCKKGSRTLEVKGVFTLEEVQEAQ